MNNERNRELFYNIMFLVIGLLLILFKIVFPDKCLILIFGASGCFAYNVYHLIRKWFRSIEFKTDTVKFPWNKVGNGHYDYSVFIPRSRHKKGPKPKVKISNLQQLIHKDVFDVRTESGGDVRLYYKTTYFPISGDYLELEITGE